MRNAITLLMVFSAASAAAQDLRWERLGSGPIISLAVAPDGLRIVTGGSDNAVRVWNTVSGTKEFFGVGHTLPPLVAWTHDGAHLVTVQGPFPTEAYSKIRLYRASDFQLVWTADGPDAWPPAIAISADDQYLALVAGVEMSGNGQVALIRLSDGHVERSLVSNGPAYNSVAFSSDGRLAAGSTSSDSAGAVDVWRVGDGALLYRRTNLPRPTAAVVFSPDDATIAIAYADSDRESGGVALLRSDTGDSLGVILSGIGQPRCVRYAPDGQHLAVAGGDRSVPSPARIQVWRTADAALTLDIIESDRAATCADFSPDGGVLLAGIGVQMQRWRVPDGLALPPIPAAVGVHQDSVSGIATDGTIVLSAGRGTEIERWDAGSGEWLGAEPTEPDVMKVRFSPTGDYYNHVTFNGRATLVRSETGETLFQVTRVSSWLECANFSPDSALLALPVLPSRFPLRTELRLYGVPAGDLRRTINFGANITVTHTAFSPDGTRIAAADYNGFAYLWRVADGQLIATRQLNSDWTTGLLFIDNERIIATARTNEVRVWRPADNALYAIGAHNFPPYGLDVSRDGRWIVTGGGSGDRTIQIWRAADEQPLHVISEGTGGGVQELAFTPDARFLACGRLDASLSFFRNPAAAGYCAGDVDADADVDLEDLGVLLANFGQADGALPGTGDVDEDGAVSITDLMLLLSQFGAPC